MKAVLDEKLCLTLTVESPLEAYAMRHWAKEYTQKMIDVEEHARAHGIELPIRGATILIDANWPPIEKPSAQTVPDRPEGGRGVV